MRPINLIPTEQRRGSSRGAGARTSFSGYIVLGVLGAAVLCALAVVMTSNQINSKTEELAGIQGDSQREKQVADALRPYGQFADLQRARMAQVKSVAESRYDWERPLRQLSRAIPRNVWLLSVEATEKQAGEGDAAGGAGAIPRENADAPSFTLAGCTYSQHAVARMMIRMRNLDDVTSVVLAKSVRNESSDDSGGAAVTADPQQQGAEEEISDCTGSARVTRFDMLVEFGGASASAAAAAGAAAVPPGSAAPIADANAAAAQGAAASTAAGGTAP